MTIWLDAHLSPGIAPWPAATFNLAAVPVRDLGLRDAEDPPIFAAAKVSGVVVMTKDEDFAEMVSRLGSPPSGALASMREHVECGSAGGPHA